MPLHTQTISFDISANKRKYYQYPPQIRDVIRSTKQTQIKQHSTYSPQSPERNLIARTKRLLQYNTSPQRFNQTAITKMAASLDVKRGVTRMKSKRGSRINQTKRQLQLLNQLYRDNNKDQIKRYQNQLEHQQSQIHSVVAQYRLKRKWNPHKTTKGRSFRQTVSITAFNPQQQSQDIHFEQKSKQKRSQFQQLQMEVNFDRMHPYRRLLITRLKNKRQSVDLQTISPSN